MDEFNDLDQAMKLVEQLRSNADAHQESEGTERRRAADQIESLVTELNAVHPRWAQMTAERSEWQIRAIDFQSKIGQVIE